MFCSEVDFFDFLLRHLSPLGYEGAFKPRPHSACLRYENNIGPDGVAIFFRESRFERSKEGGGKVLLGADGKESNSVALYVVLRDKFVNKVKGKRHNVLFRLINGGLYSGFGLCHDAPQGQGGRSLQGDSCRAGRRPRKSKEKNPKELENI